MSFIFTFTFTFTITFTFTTRIYIETVCTFVFTIYLIFSHEFRSKQH